MIYDEYYDMIKQYDTKIINVVFESGIKYLFGH